MSIILIINDKDSLLDMNKQYYLNGIEFLREKKLVVYVFLKYIYMLCCILIYMFSVVVENLLFL